LTDIRTLCEIPEDAVPLEVVEVCGWIDSKGERRWSVRFAGETPVSTTLGLLRLAEHHVIAESSTWAD
jgi:hypothetical protein